MHCPGYRLKAGSLNFFSRAFKKYTGVSPVHYRDSLHSSAFVKDERLDNPLPMSGCSIDSKSDALHTVIENNNHYQNYDEGILRMNRNARHSMAFILLLSFTLLLSACSGTSNPVATEDTAQGTNNTSAEQTSQERVLKDALGHEVKVPAQPQRVIASYLEDHLVALGVKPVAQWSVGKNSVQAYLQKELKDVPTIASDLPFEAVLSFKPDLIIMDSASMVEGDKYNQYSKIAPTYVVGSNMNNDWRQELLTVGEVLNKSSEAEQALSNYDKKAAEAKAKLSQTVGQKTAAALWETDKKRYFCQCGWLLTYCSRQTITYSSPQCEWHVNPYQPAEICSKQQPIDQITHIPMLPLHDHLNIRQAEQ
jgi:iron complex transport system substrate-binding protein